MASRRRCLFSERLLIAVRICTSMMTLFPQISARRSLLVLLTASVLLCPQGHGDGYPFDPDSQRVMVPSLRLKLTKDQIREISAIGAVKFTPEQLRLLRCYYPATTDETDVITATHNDSVEGLCAEDVYCFWVAPDEVAVTLNEKHPKEKSPFNSPVNSRLASDEELKRVASRHIRISPDGVIFFRGQPITLQQTYALIDKIALFSVSNTNHLTAENNRCLYVVVPPPAAGLELPNERTDERRTAKQIMDALAEYGAAKSIQIEHEW